MLFAIELFILDNDIMVLCQDLAQNKMRSFATKLLIENRPSHTFFKVVRRHIVALAVNPNGIIKGFNILKYKPIGMFVVNDMKSVKPFSFD